MKEMELNKYIFGRFCSNLSRVLRNPRCSLFLFHRSVPAYVSVPPYVINESLNAPPRPIVHDTDGLRELRYAGSVVRQIFQELERKLKPGWTTQDIDDFVFERCCSKKVYPSPLGYHDFPKSVCTSVNEVACHGIPSSSEVLQPGDLISVDISVYTGRAHGDACRSYVIYASNGQLLDSQSYEKRVKTAQFLCDVAQLCCEAGASICAPNVPFHDIAQVISMVADNHGCRVVAGIRGHGIGTFLHGPPEILHSVYELPTACPASAGVMQLGNVFTIEPCIALADRYGAKPEDGCFQVPATPVVAEDGWTVTTTDRALCAQFEHMVEITNVGSMILT
ncbi:Methionine aminopeptidase [Fasciola gigantica]|uniref:Methionine aminopeptidase n=1 Tax=Fasciola gigantica TaxID=46835 RepID=A0A504YRP3_FASGI|nr:Methionine aminopeptidase [Fasciola gigantica]